MGLSDELGRFKRQGGLIQGAENTGVEATGWSEIAPIGITLDPDGTPAGDDQNYAYQSVVIHGTSPNILFLSCCYQGLWRSNNYGRHGTWFKVNVTSGDDPILNGRGNLSIAYDGSYLIAGTLAPINGVVGGCWRSFNMGQTWTRSATGGGIGGFYPHPSNNQRVIGAVHAEPWHLWESRDAGATWDDMDEIGDGDVARAGMLWIDDDTILAVSDGDGAAGTGTWRGVRSGSSWPWTWSWTEVDDQEHWHGGFQAWRDPGNGYLYVGGADGIMRSTDSGATWTLVSADTSAAIVGTTSNLYSLRNYASLAGFATVPQTATRAAGNSWSTWSTHANMSNGPLMMCAGINNQGQNYIMCPCWNAGLFRYVEP